jgi:hypothetical protein
LDSVLSLHFIEKQKVLFTSSGKSSSIEIVTHNKTTADSKVRSWRFDLIPFRPFLFEELPPGVRPKSPNDSHQLIVSEEEDIESISTRKQERKRFDWKKLLFAGCF